MLNLNKILLIMLFGVFSANSIQADKINTLDSERLYKRAKSFENSSLFNEAEELYRQIFMHSPDNEKYYNALKKILNSRGLNTAVGDEGGFAPNLPSNEAAIEVILEAIKHANYEAGKDIMLGIDAASSEFYQDGYYVLKSENRALTSSEFIDLLESWVEKYPIITIEDGMDENDWNGWKSLTDRLGKRIQLVGDDLFVTNTAILKQGIDRGIANSILIKANQIGTLTETLEAIDMAKQSGYTAVISHRSGETEDTIIADLAVATNVGQIKTGSLSRSDRVAKYNQLIRIESVLNDSATYPGIKSFNQF